MAASDLPPMIKNWPARGPAPQSTSSRTKGGAEGSFGRVARTSRATYCTTYWVTATEPTSFCTLRIALPESTLRTSTFSCRVVSARIRSSSSAVG